MNSFPNKTELLKHYYQRWHDSKGESVGEWMDIMADEMDFRSLAMGRDPSVSFTAPRVSKADVHGYFEGSGK